MDNGFEFANTKSEKFWRKTKKLIQHFSETKIGRRLGFFAGCRGTIFGVRVSNSFLTFDQKFPTIVQCFAMGTILPVSQNENWRFHSSVRKALFGFSGKFLMENGAETFIFPVCTFNLLNYSRFLIYDREYNLCGAMYDTFHCPKSAIVHSWITPW